MGLPKELEWVRRLCPFGVFLADDGETYLVSTYTLPQHPVCACGPSRDYAQAIATALNLIARAVSKPVPVRVGSAKECA